jgi:hypothetical protein
VRITNDPLGSSFKSKSIGMFILENALIWQV